MEGGGRSVSRRLGVGLGLPSALGVRQGLGSGVVAHPACGHFAMRERRGEDNGRGGAIDWRKRNRCGRDDGARVFQVRRLSHCGRSRRRGCFRLRGNRRGDLLALHDGILHTRQLSRRRGFQARGFHCRVARLGDVHALAPDSIERSGLPGVSRQREREDERTRVAGVVGEPDRDRRCRDRHA